MSVVLTGDVHQAMGSADQGFVEQGEVTLAVEYARIAARHGLKVTLFLTGRAVVEESPAVRTLSALDNVEIAGHGWDALRPRWWHGLLRRVTGSPHGPPWWQGRMIRRTCAVITRHTGHSVRSWRNHAYRHDAHTPGLLARAGIAVWSDEVNGRRRGPYRHRAGITVLPLNTLPDHEHLYHGVRTPEFVRIEGRGVSYSPTAWCDRVCAQVEAIQNEGGIATVLAHPICMKVADDWATFERLCTFLARYPSLFARETTIAPGSGAVE